MSSLSKGAALVFLTGGLRHGPGTITVRAHGVMNLLPYCVCHLDLWLGPDWYGRLPTDGSDGCIVSVLHV